MLRNGIFKTKRYTECNSKYVEQIYATVLAPHLEVGEAYLLELQALLCNGFRPHSFPQCLHTTKTNSDARRLAHNKETRQSLPSVRFNADFWYVFSRRGCCCCAHVVRQTPMVEMFLSMATTCAWSYFVQVALSVGGFGSFAVPTVPTGPMKHKAMVPDSTA